MRRKEHEHEDGSGRSKLTASTTAAAVTTITTTTTTSTAPTTTVAALSMPGKVPGTKCFTYVISFQPSKNPVQQALQLSFFSFQQETKILGRLSNLPKVNELGFKSM